jgi:hypothetical protein
MKLHPTWLLAGSLLLADCAHAPPTTPTPQARLEAATVEARRELKAIIGDPERAAQADAVVVWLQALMAKSAAQAEVAARDLQALDRSRDATAAQFQALQAAADEARRADLRQAVDLRGQLARLLTAEEWKQSADVRRKLLELGMAPQR